MAWIDLAWPYTVLGLLGRKATIFFRADSSVIASMVTRDCLAYDVARTKNCSGA